MIPKKDRAFGLVELIIVVMWLGILAAIAVPRLNRAAISKNKAQTTARKIVTDLRLTRRLAISDAATNTVGFRLRMVNPSPHQTYEIVNLDTFETLAAHTIDSDVTVTSPTGQDFKFGPLGELKTGSGTQVVITAEGKSFTITIIQATGTVKCVEN